MKILYEKRDKVGWVTLNRPEVLNALDDEALEELSAVWERANKDDDVWVLVVTGAGDRAFCTGRDLRATMTVTEPYASSLFRDDPLSGLSSIPVSKPVIAAINGYAIGGGLELALACDLRICSENAAFGFREVRVGSVPGAGGTQRLTRFIPHAIAMKMILTGELISAQEAYRIGLVSDVVPVGQVAEAAERLARLICQNAPLAVRAAKLAAMKSHSLPLEQGLVLERLIWGIIRDTEDRLEGRRAFVEKRPPVWRGR